MNPFEMSVIIVAIVMFAAVFKARYKAMENRGPADDAENMRLRDEVRQLQERIKVLERITVEKENSLAKEIESLRDR
jgi:uncharacterized protein YlxW (UPF0749 family)